MNMELPPRNSTPLRVKGKRQSLSFRRRRPQQSAIEMHLVANGASPRNTSNSGHANGSLPDADSVLFHGGSKGGDDNTLDDLSKYAYSDCGGEYNLKDESQSQHQDEFGQAALEGMAGCADPAVQQQQQQQQHDEYGYVEDNKSLNLLQMMSGGESLTSNVMEAMNRSKGNNSQTPSGSEDLNQVSLTSFSQDDIMSAMAAEDSINLQRETMHDSMQEDIMNQHLIHQLITDSNSKNRNNTQESNQKDAPNPTNTTNPEGPNNQEIEFNPHESFHNNSQDGSDQEGAQPLTDLEKSILAAQAMAMAAEIDSPLHLNRNGRRRPDQKEMIPPGLQEVYVPDHKRLKQKQKKKKEERRQQKHSSLSPFVLKRNGTNGTTDSYMTNNDSLTKPIVDQDLESDTDNSKGDHSNSNKSNANTAQAQRKAKQRKAAAKSILAKRSPSNSKDGSVSTGGSKTSSSDKNNNNNNVPSSPNRGTAHAVPNQPNNLPRHNSTRDLTTTQQRPAQSLKRVKSLGCLFNSNQARLLAKEETERDDVVLFEARKYEDIQYVNVMEVSEEEESDEDTIESDTQTLKSRMSRMSRSIKRAFVSRKEMSNRRKAEQKRKAQQDEGHHYRQEEQEQVADANSNAIPQNENSDEDNTRASSGLSKSTFSRRQMLVRSISKTIRNSFRVGKSKLKSKAFKTNSNGDQQEQEEVSLGLEFGDCSHNYYNKEVGYIGNQVHMNDSLNNSKDIVFEPDIIEEEPEDMCPGFGEELDVDEMQDEFDVDELSNLRKSESWQQKQQEQQLYQEEKKIEEEQPNRPLSPNSRPNMALARSTSGSALVDMNSQDLTVVLGNSSSSVNRRLSRLDTARRHGFKNPSIDSLWEETTVRSRDSRNSKSSKSSRRRGNDSLRRPKGPPNTRYSRNQRAALNKLNLGDVVDSSLDASTHSLPNKKAKGGATTKSNKNGNSSPRTHKRSVSMDEGDLQDRRGSF